MEMDVAQQRPADHEPLVPRGASTPIGDGVQARDRRRDVPEPGAMKLVAARPRASGAQRPGRGERHLAIADHEPAGSMTTAAGSTPAIDHTRPSKSVSDSARYMSPPHSAYTGRPERANVLTASRIATLAASSCP